MSFLRAMYGGHTPKSEEKKKQVSLDGITLKDFNGVIAKAGKTNQEREADAIARADGYSFQVANTWFRRNASNTKILNHWLEQKGITQPMYADIADAAESLAQAGLLDVDEVLYVQHLDNNGPKKFVGVFTKREYTNVDEMILWERQACIEAQAAEKQNPIEEAFDALPAEEQLRMLRAAEQQTQLEADGKVSAANADSWLTLHPEFRDDTTNGKLMQAQLKLNGVTGVVTIEDYEIAERQLVDAGIIRQNPAQLKKQAAQEVLDRAKRAVETPGSIFDKTSAAEMETLPLDELRRRAAGNYSGSDRF